VFATAHERKLELQDRADQRAEKALQAAEAKAREAEAKLAAKNGANTAPKEELAPLTGAGEIPAQTEPTDPPASEINADVIKAAEEEAERERLLVEAESGIPAGNKGKGKKSESVTTSN
jgi:hypothetical protein